MRWPGQLLAVLCVALLPSAHASLDSPEKVLGSWAVLSPRMHILKPAATVRELPASANPELVRRLTPDGRAFARNNFSALMIEDGTIVFEEYAQGATRESLPVWFEGTVWKKAGAEYPAGWYLDRDGHAVAEVLVFAANGSKDHNFTDPDAQGLLAK
ncbi:hypothetical protein [Hydrogenophaga sp.]|uniref:hypothetical protein n=1 Tax=Hydrogenophaga sp. TaxID=1904254 RepID=UPI00273010FA|nr:hypothetical protein [Hydrogenophaga sp.]MDP2016037.1 hypothetical protein [Hydrogenophaga sp.]MDP3167965.1 hypothetical protein [Hydrogenophaga sp.]